MGDFLYSSDTIYFSPYDKVAYQAYLEAIRRSASSSYILNDFLMMRRRDALKLAGVSLNVKRFDDRYYIYYYYEHDQLHKLYEMQKQMTDTLQKIYPWITKDAGFVDATEKSVYVIIKHYVSKKHT